MAAPKPTPLQQAFHVIRDLEARVRELTAEPIAILGMACRFPGPAASPAQLWQLLAAGRDATAEVPPERFDVDALYDPDPQAPGKIYARRAGVLDAIDLFDARFFGISPREAIQLDPQQRLLLEVTWEALERAGLAPDRLERTATGVFVAASPSDYARLCLGDPAAIEVHGGTGNATCFAAGRISYVLGLEGPCFTVDTACSSSLLAVHLACQSLRAGECEVAIAGGVSLIVGPETFLFLSRAGNISPDGRSRAFDAAADGYGRGEGCGVIVLKRLSRALADGDPVLAVVRGSAVNHGGAASGLTVPSGLAQEAVIRSACARAGVAPRDLAYVEAHGTATLLGDPIELDALGAIAQGRDAARPLWVGSVKSNLGHLEAAAGIAGLMKVVLMLQHRQLPPSLHFCRPNPHVDWANLPLRVPTELTPWAEPEPDPAAPRLAGVSSFGLSGTNVHAILEEAPRAAAAPDPDHAVAVAADDATAPPPPPPEPCVLTLSARAPAALRALAAAYRDHLASLDPGAPAAAIAHTAALRRAHHAHRIAIAGATREAWIAALDALADEQAHPGLFAGRIDPGGADRLAFVCSGQGSQWAGMGRELFAASEVFRDSVRATAAALAACGARPILDAFEAGAPPPELARGEVVQPMLFAVQIALARLWRAWGVEPGAVVGHSAGEVAAAHIAGALTLEDAARVVAVRGELLARIAGRGGMAMIDLPAAEAAAWLAPHAPRLAIAAVNAPRATVVSGDLEALEALLAALAAGGVFARRVKIDVASHSPQVAPLLDELRARLAGIRPRDGEVPLFSTVTGGELAGRALDAAYWAQNLRQEVRFADAIEGLARAGCRRFLELSPHPILAVAIEQTLAGRGVVAASLRRGRGELEVLGEALAALYAGGHAIDWRKIYPSRRPCAPLPTYPWQRERYWIAAPAGGAQGAQGVAIASVETARAPALAGRRLLGPGEEAHFVDPRPLAAHPYLQDHRIFDDVVVPGALHLAAVLSVARELVGSERCVLESVSFPRALIGGPAGAPAVHLTAIPRGGERTRFRRASLPAGPRGHGAWDEHATGFIARLEAAAAPAAPPPDPPPAPAGAAIDPAAFYERNARRGIALGPAFRWIRELSAGGGAARSLLERPAALAAGGDGPALHPAQLDAVLQTIAAAIPDDPERAYVPFSIDRLELHELADGPWRCDARGRPGDTADFVAGDAVVRAADDRVLLRLEGLRLRRVARADLAAGGAPAFADWIYEARWELQARPAAPPLPAGERWLIFADAGGVADRLVEQLRARGDRCVTATCGAGYARRAEDAYVVDPERRGELDRLVAAVAADAPPTAVVFLWGLADPPPAGAPPAPPRELAAGAVAGLLHAAQALAEAPWRAPPRVTLVTRGAQQAGEERHPLDLAAAMRWGMARSFLHERPALGFARIDLDPDPAAGVIDALVAELVAGDREDEVLLRREARRVGRLARPPRIAAPDASPVRGDGASYLVTGGLGGLGLRLAGWLADAGARHLVLVGRRGAEAAAQREALEALAARGVRAEAVAADVAERAQLERALARARALGPLRGVIHAAGVLDDGPLDRQTLERYRGVLAPKAAGALHLDELTRADALDFFVLFSSAAALLGAPAQSNYAAANAALDALALDRRARGLPALSVAWGAFAEVGMAARAPVRGERLATRGIAGMSPADGLAALGALLGRGVAHAAVIALDARQWLEASPHLARSRRFAELAGPGREGASASRAGPRALEALRAASPAERRDRIAALLRRELGLVLRLDARLVEPAAPLMSLGFDSLLSLELRNRLEALFGLTLPAVLLWTYPTLEALTEHLARQVQPDEAEPDAEPPAAEPPDAEPAADSPDAELDALSEPERQARLAALVRRLS